MPKHITRLILLLIGFLVFAYAGIVFLTDPSFYRFGHYRADVVPELAAAEPKYLGPDYCSNCHVDRHGDWSSGSHKTVKCEICHGPAADHPANGKLPIPEDPVKLCTICHEALPARPAGHPQVVLAEHPYPSDTQVICTNCHNPHSPRIGDPAEVVQTSQVSIETEPTGTVGIPLTAKSCATCHGAAGQGMGVFPALAGVPASQFTEQMKQFKTGEVPSPMMSAIANGLSDAEIRELANYYAAMESELDQ